MTGHKSSDDLLGGIKASTTRMLPHIPKAARPFRAGKQADLKKINILSENLGVPDTVNAWHNLLLFRRVSVMERGGKFPG